MPYWRKPLLQVGGALFLVFFSYHYVLERATLAPLAEQSTFALLTSIVDYVYYIAVVVCTLAFLAYTLPQLIPKSVFLPTPTIGYGFVIVRLLNPLDDPITRIKSTVETFPGFPYYSRESDHPGSWPPRVNTDRKRFGEELRGFYLAEDVVDRIAKAREQTGDTSSVQFLTSAPQFDDPAARAYRNDSERVAGSRLFLHERLKFTGSNDVIEILGSNRAQEFFALEQARNRMAATMPNRLAILRCRNTAKTTLKNVTIEFEVAGSIYDIVMTGKDGDLEKPDWSIFANRVEILRFPPGLLIEVRVWYWYQELAGRAFPDKIDLIWEACQGMRIVNLAVDNGKIEYNPRLVKEISAYQTLYVGDGRKKDNYEQDIANVLKTLSQANAAAREKAELKEKHGSFTDVPSGGLAALDVSDPHIDNVWLQIRSPGGCLYRMVFVYKHPKGPYALVSSDDKDEEDLRRVQSTLAKLQDSEANEKSSDRGSDICVTVSVPGGFSVERIEDITAELVAAGFTEPRYLKVHYTVPAS